ncbi:MAG: diguanylate cyclase domain-containing protein [Candidatus Izemoplasmataceae bacterium]
MDMGTFLHFDISIYAILYLGMLFVLIVLRREIYSVSSKLILYIIATNIWILLMEVFSWVVDGLEGDLYYYLSYLVNSLLFISVGFIVSFWLSYVDYVMYRSKERLQQKRYYLWVALITTLFTIVNLFVPILFNINEENIYVRGFFFELYYFLFVLLFVYSIIMTIYKEHLEEIRDVIWTIYLFLGIVFIAGIFQTMFYGVLLIWPVMALATSIVYIFLETTTNNRDYVTKLYTRLKADQYIRHLKDDGEDFAVVMIDLDNYKDVNDTFGHIVGDEVLRVFARGLLKVFGDDGMVVRFGGDEFLIVLKGVDEQYLNQKKDLIQQTIGKDMERFSFDKIAFSYGYSFDEEDKSVNDIIVEADNKMYEDKAKNKNLRRRKTD